MKKLIRIISIFLLMYFLVSTHAYAEPGWVGQKIQMAGQAAMDTSRYPQLEHAKMMAQREAMLDAKRNLLEEVLHLKLNPETTVWDVAPVFDRTNADTSELVKSAYIINLSSGDYSIRTVKMELRLSDVYNYLKSINKVPN